MNYSRVIGTGSYLPKQILKNEEFEKIVDTSDEWIVSRTGIHQRHICSNDEGVISMAVQASQRALEAADVGAHEIDLIIVATSSPENFFPSTACSLQDQLNVGHCIAFDITAACSGFIYALSTADQFIRSGKIKTSLIIGSETMSRVVDWYDRNTCVLFGDGAGAVVLKADEKPGIVDTKLFADGHYQDLLNLPSGLSREVTCPLLAEPVHQCVCHTSEKKLDTCACSCENKAHVHMKGRELFKIAVEAMSSSVKELLKDNNLTIDDVDWIIPHQANLRIINSIIQKLEISSEKVVITLSNQANTSSASVPLALDIAIRDGRIYPNQTLLLEAFGGGLTWGSVLINY